MMITQILCVEDLFIYQMVKNQDFQQVSTVLVMVVQHGHITGFPVTETSSVFQFMDWEQSGTKLVFYMVKYFKLYIMIMIDSDVYML